MRLAIVVVLLLVVGTSAQAQPLDPASAARQLYATGRVDFEAGRFKQAATAFHAAYALMPLPGLLFNEASSLRRAYELTGNRESAMDAIELYERFLDTPGTNLVEAQEAAGRARPQRRGPSRPGRRRDPHGGRAASHRADRRPFGRRRRARGDRPRARPALELGPDGHGQVVRSLALALLAATLAGCGGDGAMYALTITPSARATQATTLVLSLTRLDRPGSTGFEFPLPSPTPTPPWRLDIHSGAWGSAPFHVDAEASDGSGVLASGGSDARAGAVEIVLQDAAPPPADGPIVDAATPGVIAPRLVFPPCGSTVSRARPTLELDMSGASGTVVVDLCADRACTISLGSATLDVNGTHALPDEDLPVGRVFWRARATAGGVESASPTWELVVPQGTAVTKADTASGVVLDVNGDGYADVAVGAPLATIGAAARVGRVYVYLGGPTGITATDPSRVEVLDGIDGFDTRFGSAVAALGDINGDGYGDLAISILSSVTTGAVYVYLGAADGVSQARRWRVSGTDGAGANFGQAVAAGGDIDHDGYADLLVGAPYWSRVGGFQDGRMNVFYGGASAPRPIDTRISGTENDSYLGNSLDGAGDVNGDGYADVAVGIPGASTSSGAVQVYLGGPGGLDPTAPTKMFSFAGAPGSGLGSHLAMVGDLDGDGLDELAASSPLDSIGGADGVGRVHLYGGSVSGPTVSTVIDGTDGDFGFFGYAISGGDLDGDGHRDLVIASLANSVGGRVRIFNGSATGVTPLQPASVQRLDGPDGSNSFFGAAVRVVGDTDGDHLADLVVGESGYDNYDERARVLHGAKPVTLPGLVIEAVAGLQEHFGDTLGRRSRRPHRLAR